MYNCLFFEHSTDQIILKLIYVTDFLTKVKRIQFDMNKNSDSFIKFFINRPSPSLLVFSRETNK